VPSVPGYRLAAPTEADLRFALERHLGREQAADLLWELCGALKLPRDGRPLDLAQVARIAAQLETHPGTLRVVGRSMLIRVRTYQLLAERLGTAPAAPPDEAPQPASPSSPFESAAA
jgi:hypothetical protein